MLSEIGALEAIKSGSTSVVEFASGISSTASALAKSGLRMVLMESAADSENVLDPNTVLIKCDPCGRSGNGDQLVASALESRGVS